MIAPYSFVNQRKSKNKLEKVHIKTHTKVIKRNENMATSVDHLLGKLKDPKAEMGLVRKGIKPTLIEAFFNQEKLPIKEILAKLNISSSTYFAKKKHHKTLDSYSTEKFIRLISIVAKANKILGQDEARRWIYSKIPSLDNETPIDLLDTEVGHRLVLQALLQIEHGIYS